MTLPRPRLYNPISDKHLLPQLAQTHADCILCDHQLATFLPPLSDKRMLDYWKQISSDVEKGRMVIVLQFGEEEKETELAGYVCLMMPATETGPFRGEVNKLMVSPKHRRKGVARRVMGVLESVARERGRELLTLDTTIGLPAEQMYPKLGYIEYGVIPKYGISPEDGRLVDERFFYKDLRDHEAQVGK